MVALVIFGPYDEVVDVCMVGVVMKMVKYRTVDVEDVTVQCGR